MKINIEKEITIKELITGYKNLNEDGVYALNGELEVRPPYQREFVYEIPRQAAVIDSIIHNYPIGLIYLCKKEDGTYECLDGQQRIMSICEFAKDRTLVNVEGSPCKYEALKDLNSPIIDVFHNYKMLIAICEGSEDEKLKWFERINTAGEPLTNQEMRNAIYAGTWVTDAKRYFAKDKCGAWHKTTKGYGEIFLNKLRMNRQEWLEQVIKWKLGFDGADMSDMDTAIKTYMLNHKNNEDASDLIEYFEDMISWVRRNFPKYDKLMGACDWGALYNKYHDVELNPSETGKLIKELQAYGKADGITNLKGIYEYVFDGNLKHLSERSFPDEIKVAKWDMQDHKCNYCKEEFNLEDMHGDHVLPWSKGGKTTLDNCQMLCPECNGLKSAKMSKEAKENVERLRIKLD